MEHTGTIKGRIYPIYYINIVEILKNNEISMPSSTSLDMKTEDD